MKTITLEIEKDQDLEQIRSLVESLGIKIIIEEKEKPIDSDIQKKLEALEKIAGTITSKPIPSEALRRINLYD